MKKTLLLFVATLIFSCNTSKFLQENKRILLLKKFAFCKCFEMANSQYEKTDSSEVSIGDIRNLIDYNGMFLNHIEPLLVLELQIVLKDSNKINTNSFYKENLQGGRTYNLKCLNFYESKKLDSILKSVPKEKYIVSY